MSLSIERVNEDVSSHSNQEHLVYVNAIPALVGEKENERSDKGEREQEKEGVTAPTLVVESTDHEEESALAQHRKSVELLNTAETANAIKFKLGEAIINDINVRVDIIEMNSCNFEPSRLQLASHNHRYLHVFDLYMYVSLSARLLSKSDGASKSPP